ncbi:MAG: heat-inducible transcription repressor HrcA [Acidobacteria bacterium]|nr:MAG: heat-inducible transcription repressor HrcA [Acidobacteriota bacterium]
MPRQKRPLELNQRSKNILRQLIREHIRTGEPVGSRRLAKLAGEKLSSATIRNVVADLEEMGFVGQPHTSAGRVPTEKGYRFYVDSLVETKELTDREGGRIRASLEKETDPDKLMDKASQILSAASDNIGFVMAPPVSLAVMKHIEFVRISERRILVILVTSGGLVQHRLIHVDEDFEQDVLHQAGRYLVENFEGKTLLEIRDELLKLMQEEKGLYDRLLRSVVVLGSASLMQQDADADATGVYVQGTARIIQRPELADVNRMIALFRTFEEKSRLVKILSECLKANSTGPTVTIGLEKHLPGMQDWALIASPYIYTEGQAGSLGIIGPSRMEYEKVISLVDYVAKLFGKILSRN